MRAFIVFLLQLFSISLFAQPYIEGGKTRHRFAQLNLGIDERMFLSGSSRTSFINSTGTLETKSIETHPDTRLIIGGTHFWGHADFYIAFPVASAKNSSFKTGVETGARYFPLNIRNRKLRPFVGMAWLATSFKQGDGAELVRRKFPVTSGVVYNYKNHLFELAAGFNFSNEDSYYISRTISVPIKTPPFWVSVGYKFMLDATAGAEKDWQSGRTKAITDTLSKYRRLNGFTIGAGPSTAIFLKKSRHNEITAPYIDNQKLANVFPEFVAGYYLNNPDVQFNLAFRKISGEIKAFGYSQKAVRKALTFEVYKFFGDYHGFVPFAGPAVSYENLEVKESDNGQVETSAFNGIKPGIIFGWDIRPDRLQAWYLRTNLRWFPGLNVKMNNGSSVSFDQLEFNFIQLVIFPGRLF